MSILILIPATVIAAIIERPRKQNFRPKQYRVSKDCWVW